MQVHMFHLMPWQKLPEEYFHDYEKYPAAWVTYPNTFFEPEEGAALYNAYLDQLEYAETLGFDGVCVNEHHQNHYGLMPAPNIIAALLARRTRRVRSSCSATPCPCAITPSAWPRKSRCSTW
jgi:hypothetical protein